jgi:glycosyltransferase involved in cell wall biosynthesis
MLPTVLQIGKYYPPHMGGIETHVAALCQSLLESVHVNVVVCGDGPATIHESMDGVPVTRAGRVWKVASTSICPRMVRIVKNKPADLVHIHLPNPMAVVAYLGSGHRGKLVVTYHSDTVRQKVLGALFQPLLSAVLHRSAAIIVTTQNYLDSSATLAPFRAKCHVIPYGVDVSKIQQVDAAQVAAIRSRFGSKMILAVGRLVYYKGFEYLIDAMKDCPGHLVIIGDGPLRASLEADARKAAVSDRVTFLGEISNEDTFPYFHAASVFCLPSVARSEAFGIVQIEAMSAGTPVVNTSLRSGVPFVSLDGQTGLTVPASDSARLGEALKTLLENDKLRDNFGRAAVRRAESEFAVARMAERTLRLYQQVLNGAPRLEWHFRSQGQGVLAR